MAVPAGTFTTHDAVGNREALADIIYDISPTDTPFMSNIARHNSTATFEEWQTDSLAAATSLNAHADGDDSAANTAQATVRYGNYNQIMKKVPRVSGTQRAVSTAGRADELNYQILKRGQELKRDCEKALLSTNAATAGASGSARVLAGVGVWIFDEDAGGNAIATAAGFSTTSITSGAPKTAITTTTSVSALTVTRLKSAIANCWNDGGDPTLILGDATQKMVMSGFTGIATLYRDSQGEQPAVIIGAADIYISDFGTHYIVADRFMPANNVYVLDLDYWAVAYLREYEEEPLSKTGDSDRVQIITECTLKALNPNSSAKIYGMG